MSSNYSSKHTPKSKPSAKKIIGRLPYKSNDSEASAAHTVLGAAVAVAGSNDALLAGVSAGGAEASAPLLAKYLYGKESKDLTVDEKGTVSAITGLVASGVGASTGDVASTVQSGQLAQNAVENNASIAGAYAKKKSEQYNDLCKQSGISAGQCSEWTGQRIINNSKELAMIIVPTEIYELIPVGKGVGIISKATGKVIAKFDDAKQAEKVLENIKVSKKARESSNFKKYSEDIRNKYFENINSQNFFENTKYTSKVNAQIQKDNYHGFPATIDELAKKYGKTTVFTGSKDGVPRLKLELEGNYNGRKGTFEYLRNHDGTINHRLFVPNKD